MIVFKKEVELATRLTPSEIVEKLSSITEMYFSGNSNGTFFEGKIDESKFNILPTFNYGSRGQLRPELIGEIINSGGLTKVKILFQLPKLLKNILITALLGNILLIVLMISLPNLISHPIWSLWWGLLLGLLTTFILFLLYFNFKVSKSIYILKTALLTN